MDAANLRIFETVARLGGMKSNVSARVRHLEEMLATPLFDRRSNGVVLTAAGQRLLPFAVRIARLLDDARRAVDDDGRPNGVLTLGSLETTAALRLSPVLSAYASAFPEVDLVLRTGTSAELIEQVLGHRLEGAFVCGPIDHPELEQEAVFEEKLVVVTAGAVRSIDQLARAVGLKIVVLRAGCSYRQRLEEVLARRGIVGLRRLEFGTLDSIIGCVAAGLGVTLLPEAVVAAARREGRVAVHELPASEARVETLFIRRHDAYVSSALDAFLQCARLGHALEEIEARVAMA
jgi:DNA-binding transcriptional LysR family regulator